ncbi:MAG: hypothetical protein M1820_006250 [Bogoriella megaspora]|nr:MAG: hypothetical protein M1820_006250 [Bogoriella megaspora]
MNESPVKEVTITEDFYDTARQSIAEIEKLITEDVSIVTTYGGVHGEPRPKNGEAVRIESYKVALARTMTHTGRSALMTPWTHPKHNRYEALKLLMHDMMQKMNELQPASEWAPRVTH